MTGRSDRVPAGAQAELLTLRGVSKTYVRRPRPWSRPVSVPALDHVDLTLGSGEVLALVGESGAGKSTLARLAAGHEGPDRGTVEYGGEDLARVSAASRRSLRCFVQLVFQDPAAALDPRMRLAASIEEPLVVQGRTRPGEVLRLAHRVGLDPERLQRFPHEVSGGQKQRAVFARALALSPRVLVCDEPLASLDASAAAQIMLLMRDLASSEGLGLLFITHDLAAAAMIATRVAVMLAGRIVEQGSIAEVFGDPQHAHTRALLAAVPGGLEVGVTSGSVPR